MSKNSKRRQKPQREAFKTRFSPSVIAQRLHEGISCDFGIDYPELELTQLYNAQVVDTDVNRMVKAIRSKRMIDEFKKKFTNETDRRKETPQSIAAVEKFTENLKRLSNLDVDLPNWFGGAWSERPDKRTIILARARSLIYNLLGPLDLDDVAMNMKHSSGTTQGLSFIKTNIDDKQRFPITATPSQAVFMMSYFAFDPEWVEAALTNSAPVWRVMYNLDPYAVFDITHSSQGTTVPKDENIARFIAKETTVGMYEQKGVEASMYTAFRQNGDLLGLHNWCDVESLQFSHRLRAQIASVTGSEATIDWSNASDNWLRLVVRWLCPPDWYNLLVSIGSRLISVKQADWSVVEYKMPMISTMGNATTFPLETLLFYAIGMAVVSYHHDQSTTVCPDWAEINGSVSVFGDDCILPTQCALDFIEILESLGHQVNRNKSFLDGAFRESCGGDYYLHHDVRPFFLRWPTATSGKENLEAWLNIVFNRLYQKYTVYFDGEDILQFKVFEVLASIYRQYDLVVRIVPEETPDDAGWKVEHSAFASCSYFSHLPVTNILVDQHGTVCFSYLAYDFPNKYCSSDHVGYATWLKQPTVHTMYESGLNLFNPSCTSIFRRPKKRKLVRSRENEYMVPLDQDYLVKKGGQYVVRISYTSWWSESHPYAIRVTRDVLGGIDSRMFRYTIQD